jgi:acetyltransferase
MSTYRLDRLFQPRSIALIGASTRERSLGRAVLKNLRDGGFKGEIWVVNPKYSSIDGHITAHSISVLPETPDVAVITAPAATVPDLVSEAGRRGVAVAVVITAGLGHGPGSLADQCQKVARTLGLRIIGPNGLGVLVPPMGLNASFAARAARPGELALVSQSGAVAAGLIEWSTSRAIGFSAIVSLGDAIDVDFGDLLDYFALDPRSRAILLYIEAISTPAKFLSAARAAARVKPVIVIKAGRQAQGARAATTHTGALAGSDAVYDAVFRRAGLLRVMDLEEMFVAAEALGRTRALPGKRLTILTNGGGVGVLAIDRLIELGGIASELSAETQVRLDALLPAGWSKSNPVDIIGDADGERYARALEILIADPNSDAVLVLNVPTALAPAAGCARAIAEVVVHGRGTATAQKPVFAGWIGESLEAAKVFQETSIPHYATEADAVQGFMHLARFRESQDTLIQTPETLTDDLGCDVAAARQVVDNALGRRQAWLDPLQISQLLQAYRIAIPSVRLVRDPLEAYATAEQLLKAHSSLVAKILSPDILHKSDVAGVRLGLSTPEQVGNATADILATAQRLKPQARITGVTLHPMVQRSHGRELIAGIADDPTFGPVIVFGCGGTAVEVVDDKALMLPPLDLKSAHDLVLRTRVSRLLAGYRDVPAADLRAVELVLVKLALMASDLPEIRDVDLNPLVADESGIIVLDARVAVAPFLSAEQRAHGTRLSIRPYPSTWRRNTKLMDGCQIQIRPIRPEDEVMVRSFFDKVKDEDVRLRFFSPVRHFTHPFVARLTQLDYSRSIAFIAIGDNGDMLGVVHLHSDGNHEIGEFAVLVRSDAKGRGLGWQLMQMMLEYARAEGLQEVSGQVLRENHTMLRMCEELGFIVAPVEGVPEVVLVRLPVNGKLS